jgi:DNA-binding NarL/FixJ family response regulator
MTSPYIRILVADDHPVVRDGLVAVLGTQPDFHVVGEAGDEREAVEMAANLRPDIVMLDLEMPEVDGVDALRQMKDREPEIRVIVFTVFDTDERILAAVQAGAQGYLLKGAPRHQFFDAVRVVNKGESLLQPVVASKLMRRISRGVEERNVTESLTPRELEVLKLLAKGLQKQGDWRPPGDCGADSEIPCWLNTWQAQGREPHRSGGRRPSEGLDRPLASMPVPINNAVPKDRPQTCPFYMGWCWTQVRCGKSQLSLN